MVFGEIVEPSSRALWEDDFVDFPEDERLEFNWDTDLKTPETIDKLLIGETAQIVLLLQKSVVQSLKPLYELTKVGVSVYKIENNSYIVTYKTQPEMIVGKITEKFIPWLKTAKQVLVLTAAPLTSLQNCSPTEMSPCIIRTLCSKNVECKYLNLEVPNLVTGLAASVLSYSVHQDIACSLYIGFLDDLSLDSLNTQPLIDLLQYLGISPVINFILEEKTSSNNLYM